MIGRLRVPDLVAGAGGFALLASMFLHWYGLALPGGPEVTAWQAFSVLDVVLALLALVPFALVFTQATRDSPALPVLFSVLTACAGAIAALLILYRIANQPGPNDVVEVEAGAWLAFLAAVVVAAGGWASMRVEAMPGRPERPVEHMPAPAP
ncbi:MAG: hypothetical protein ABW060_17135 [Solirubrobacteraceae bacterium]